MVRTRNALNPEPYTINYSPENPTVVEVLFQIVQQFQNQVVELT